MTREDFIEGVTSWPELREFCDDNGCDFCDDIYSQDEMEEYIDDHLRDSVDNCEGWRDLLRILNDIPTGHGYVRQYDDLEYRPLDEEDFEDWKSDVLDWADDECVWDGDEEEDIEEYDEEDEFCEENADDFAVNEPCTIEELMTICNNQAQHLV